MEELFKMITIETLREELRSANWAEIARDTGIPYITVHRILSGVTETPSYQYVAKIAAWYLKNVQ